MPQRLADVPLSELVPDTKKWNSGAGISLECWIYSSGTIEVAIALGEMFWPDYFEFDNCVFRGDASHEEKIRKSYPETLLSLKNDRAKVERLLNHLHVWDIFARAAGDPQPSRDQCLYLARLLREMWEGKLQRDFPERSFKVVVNEEGAAAADGDFQVTFSQE